MGQDKCLSYQMFFISCLYLLQRMGKKVFLSTLAFWGFYGHSGTIMVVNRRDANIKLTENRDVDAVWLRCPDGSRDGEADLTGEVGVFVLLHHLVLQRALHRVQAFGLPGQDQHVYIWRVDKTMKTHVDHSLKMDTVVPICCSHLRPGSGVSGTLFLYQVMLGLGKPFVTSHDATWMQSHFSGWENFSRTRGTIYLAFNMVRYWLTHFRRHLFGHRYSSEDALNHRSLWRSCVYKKLREI